jgi:hypothetical protein
MERERCSYCSGHGVVPDYGPFGADFYGPKECPICKGNGMEYDPIDDLGLILKYMLTCLNDGYDISRIDVERAVEHLNAIKKMVEELNKENEELRDDQFGT